jgi:hypothetical protein
MSDNTEHTKLENFTYNVLSTLNCEPYFLSSTVEKYIQDAQSDGRQNLVEIWKEIKQDKQRHLTKLIK